jgi:hypothetical protein
MIESPLLNNLIAEEVQRNLLQLLEDRFGPVPFDIAQRVKEITNRDQLRQLTSQAGRCPDLDSFRRALERDTPK